MQRFVPRALFKMAAPFNVLSVLLGRKGYGRNGFGPKWFRAENEQMASDAFIFKFASVSEFCRHKTDDRKMRTPFLFALISMQQYVAKKRSLKESSKECLGALWGAFLKHTVA